MELFNKENSKPTKLLQSLMRKKSLLFKKNAIVVLLLYNIFADWASVNLSTVSMWSLTSRGYLSCTHLMIRVVMKVVKVTTPFLAMTRDRFVRTPRNLVNTNLSDNIIEIL